jgi:hypothetical protein
MDSIVQAVAKKTTDVDMQKVSNRLKSMFGIEPTPWWKKPEYYIPAAFIGGIAFAKSIFGSKKS